MKDLESEKDLDFGNETHPCWPDQTYCFVLFSWFQVLFCSAWWPAPW